jgi:hypothetical protein
MTRDTYEPTDELIRCLELASEFARRATALQSALMGSPGTHPKEHAALRRTGLELTRALAELRRSTPYRRVMPAADAD